MIDISDVVVEVKKIEGVDVQVVLPASDMKEVFIPSPPTTIMSPCNPRKAIIALTALPVDDAMKASAKEKKLVYLVPAEDVDADGVLEIYTWANRDANKLNIIKDKIFVQADAGKMDLANEAVELIEDDFDVEEAEEFAL